MTQTLTIRKPDDFHVHFRDGQALMRTVNDSAQRFARALVMPNLVPAITTPQLAAAYKRRILDACQYNFQPLFALYLQETTTVQQIKAAAADPDIIAFKLYPSGATTNSAQGIKNFNNCAHIFAALEAHHIPLCIHGEVTNPAVDVFDREQQFIDQYLMPLLKKFPNLKVILEHISTEYAVNFIKSCPRNVAATITCHHLLYQRNHLLANKLRPHYYCLPILKRETDRKALLAAATSGDNRFFLGTDSAPHAIGNKESACGCAGIYTAHAAIELYCSAFASVNKLDRLESFASEFGARFYKLPLNTETITLENTIFPVDKSLVFADQHLQPLRAGETIPWKLRGQQCQV